MNASGNLPSFSRTIRGLRIGTQVWTATSRVRTADGDPPRDDLIEMASCARKFLPFFRADTLDLRAISRRVEKRPQLRRRWRSLPQRHRPSHLMLSIRPASDDSAYVVGADFAIDGRVEKRPQLRRRWRSLPQRHRPSHLMLSIRPASRSRVAPRAFCWRSEEHTSELQSHLNLVCRLLLEKKKKQKHIHPQHTKQHAPNSLT